MEELERKYAERKQLHKLQWIGQPEVGYKQAGIPFGDTITRIPEAQGVEVSDSEDGWTTCSNSGSEKGNIVGKIVENFSSLGTEFQATVGKYGEGWSEKIQAWQKRADMMNSLWEDYM